MQIACTPRKLPVEMAFIRDLFWTRNPDFRRFPWLEIRDVDESQGGGDPAQRAVDLSLCRMESCPLTILEAMACGCVTAGFTGLGGREYTTMRNGFWADEDDCIDETVWHKRCDWPQRVVRDAATCWKPPTSPQVTTAASGWLAASSNSGPRRCPRRPRPEI